MKLNFMDRLRVLMTGTIDEHNKAFLSGDDIAAPGVDVETAMKYSAVNACVRVRAETFASVPALLYRKTADGREQVTDHDLADIWHGQPNSEMSSYTFKETIMANFDVSGNAVCQRLFNGAGEFIGLVPVPHSLVRIDRDKDTNRLIYIVRQNGQDKTLQRDEVFHVPNLSFDGVVGMSPITYAAQAIRLGMSYDDYGVRFYANAATPSGVLEHPTGLDEKAAIRLRDDIKKNYGGLKNAGVPMLLEGGMKWHQVTINPIDAQLLESKYFQIEDICRIYRVPQHLVNKLDRSTFNNIEMLSLEFVIYTMLPIFKRYEDAISAQLLKPADRKKGLYVEFKVDGLLRGDIKTRAESYAQGRQWGYLSVNDIRKLENLPGIGPAGDIYMQPLNFVEAGTQAPAATNHAKLVDDIARMISERR